MTSFFQGHLGFGFVRMNADRHDNRRCNGQGLHQNVEMPVGHRIEGSGIESYRHSLPAGCFDAFCHGCACIASYLQPPLRSRERWMNAPFKPVSDALWLDEITKGADQAGIVKAKMESLVLEDDDIVDD